MGKSQGPTDNHGQRGEQANARWEAFFIAQAVEGVITISLDGLILSKNLPAEEIFRREALVADSRWPMAGGLAPRQAEAAITLRLISLVRAKMFDPSFTTRFTGRGLGSPLCLASCGLTVALSG